MLSPFICITMEFNVDARQFRAETTSDNKVCANFSTSLYYTLMQMGKVKHEKVHSMSKVQITRISNISDT